MTTEVIMVAVNTFGVLVVAVGLGITWRRNGTEQAQRDLTLGQRQAVRDAALANNQESIMATLNNKETGLQAVNSKLAGQRNHCTKVSTALVERMAGHDRELKEIKAK